jgi:hypothetical protein
MQSGLHSVSLKPQISQMNADQIRVHLRNLRLKTYAEKHTNAGVVARSSLRAR